MRLGRVERILLAVVVVCCALAATVAVLAHRASTTGSASNAALADPGATERVTNAVRDGLSRAFSYSYASLDTAQQQAHAVLVGDARRRFDTLLPKLRAQAGEQQLVQQTTVRKVAVRQLHGDTARLLVFVSQQRLHSGKGSRSAATAMNVTAHRTGGHWKISEISFESHGGK